MREFLYEVRIGSVVAPTVVALVRVLAQVRPSTTVAARSAFGEGGVCHIIVC